MQLEHSSKSWPFIKDRNKHKLGFRNYLSDGEKSTKENKAGNTDTCGHF